MKKLIYLSLLLIPFAGCKKEEKKPQLDGTYKGTLITLVNKKQNVSEFEFTLDGKRFFTAVGGVGVGPFEVGDKSNIKFVDEMIYTGYVDWNTLLVGEYRYQIKGDSLILDKVIPLTSSSANPNDSFKYRLKKIK